LTIPVHGEFLIRHAQGWNDFLDDCHRKRGGGYFRLGLGIVAEFQNNCCAGTIGP
jgi:hypothetical protein